VTTKIVIPCYNEEARLSVEAFRSFISGTTDIDILFVDDGSTDGTVGVLHTLVEFAPDRFRILEQPYNMGKAEAVRVGIVDALHDGASYVGFWDADLATPLDAISDFIAILNSHPETDMVIGSRVKLLGHHVERDQRRHYLGRIFATVVSSILHLAVYDTQCGAKLFRATPENTAAFIEPFVGRWVFDVEILARIIKAQRIEGGRPVSDRVYELPLQQWHDIAGSKLRPFDFVKAGTDLWRIYRKYLHCTSSR
jgi:dolichyl-phosphate beta-glucosyltransferase